MTHNVLVVGGSGYVAGLVLPLLPDRFRIHIFDRNPPAWAESLPSFGHTFIHGDVTDPESLRNAAQGMDLLLYMAMGGGHHKIHIPSSAYDVNVKGVHLALEAAVDAGIKRAVYTSSLSVYDPRNITSGETDSEDVVPEPRRVYGFTKYLGEIVCQYVSRTHGLPILALRLFHPVSEDDWHKQRAKNPPDRPFCHTTAADLARALTAALDLEHTGFEAIHVTGDTTGRAYHHEKAKRLLNWEPLQK